MIKLNKLLIDNEDYSDYAVWTLQGQETLDESLDLNYVELKGTDIELPFKPFLDIEIEIEDNSGIHTIRRLVESDTVTEVIGNKTFNHNLLFIEETKWLERLFVEKTIRQPLIHDYSDLNPDIYVSAYSKVGAIETSVSGNVALIDGVLRVNNTYKVKNPAALMRDIDNSLNANYYWQTGTAGRVEYILDIKLNGELVKQEIFTKTSANEFNEDTFEFTPTKEGIYEFNLTNPSWDGGTYVGNVTGEAYFSVSAIIDAEPREDYTIRDVVNQLLETCITLRENEEPLFKIAEPNEYAGASEDYKKQIEVILNTSSPEFTFSKMSLFEALKTIGDFAHFIPRLQDRKIYFDLLGQMEYADILEEYYSNISAQASNDFCNALDSQVNNLTNMDDEAQGSVTTPYNAGYRTLRSETGNVQITDGNIIIPTEDNIEKVIKLEIGYLSDGSYVGDITPFVFEEDEYNTLSSYDNAFPTSRMYAIKYKQGSKNITELTWKRPNVVSPAFENIAIKNIIYKKLNKSTSWWNNFWESENVFKLQYRLTYIPSTNTKVTQFKQNTEDISDKPLYIAYNQGAGKVSSNAYGENLKGTIAKLGNVVKTKMYILPTFDLIPKCGTLFDKDYYISVVKYEVYPNFIKCEVGLSKNYNNKSAYVEINSQLEFFEYNRNLTVDRYVVYEEFCEISDGYPENENSNSLINYIGLEMLGLNFEYEGEYIPVSSVIAQGHSNRSGYLTEVVLPVISLGVGNSLLFAFHYEDTVSAGTMAFDSARGRYQNHVKYTDIYGEMDKLKLKFGVNFETPSGYDDAVARGDNLPLTNKFGEMETFFETGDNKIVIKKGVGEAIHFTYQIHFVTNNKDYVIGSGLTRKNIFVSRENKMYKLYALKNEINKFETKIDLTNAVEIGKLKTEDYDKNSKYVKLKTEDRTPSGSYKAWAIVQTYNNGNDLILGKNMEFKGGELLDMPAFTFKRRVK